LQDGPSQKRQTQSPDFERRKKSTISSMKKKRGSLCTNCRGRWRKLPPSSPGWGGSQNVGNRSRDAVIGHVRENLNNRRGAERERRRQLENLEKRNPNLHEGLRSAGEKRGPQSRKNPGTARKRNSWKGSVSLEKRAEKRTSWEEKNNLGNLQQKRDSLKGNEKKKGPKRQSGNQKTLSGQGKSFSSEAQGAG